jgi:hypothetical protein
MDISKRLLSCRSSEWLERQKTLVAISCRAYHPVTIDFLGNMPEHIVVSFATEEGHKAD